MLRKAIPNYGLSFEVKTQIKFQKMQDLITGLLTYYAEQHDLVIEGWEIHPSKFSNYQK